MGICSGTHLADLPVGMDGDRHRSAPCNVIDNRITKKNADDDSICFLPLFGLTVSSLWKTNWSSPIRLTRSILAQAVDEVGTITHDMGQRNCHSTEESQGLFGKLLNSANCPHPVVLFAKFNHSGITEPYTGAK